MGFFWIIFEKCQIIKVHNCTAPFLKYRNFAYDGLHRLSVREGRLMSGRGRGPKE